MSAEANLATVKAIYEAFGRGDVAAILENVTDDVDWATDSAGTAAPWWGPKHGKQEVVTFFEGIAAAGDVTDFAPLSFAANDDDVMVLIRFTMVAKATGKEASMTLHHYWHFRDGKVAQYRGSEDTALVASTLAD